MSKKTQKMYTAMVLHKNPQTTYGPMTLPKGCVGIMFVFGTKVATRAWEGRNKEVRELLLSAPRSTPSKSSKS